MLCTVQADNMRQLLKISALFNLTTFDTPDIYLPAAERSVHDQFMNIQDKNRTRMGNIAFKILNYDHKIDVSIFR